MRPNKVKYSTAPGLYCTTHDVKVRFYHPYFSRIKIISHRFHVDNNEVESVIVYGMIIGSDLMVQLGLSEDFKRQVHSLEGIPVPMKELSDMFSQTDQTSCEMREVVMKTEEQVSTKEATERLLKILNSTYAKSDLKQIANNVTQMNAEKELKYSGSLKMLRTCFMVL